MLDADAYLEQERQSETKHELVHGVAVAMAGGTPKHDAIAANVIGALEHRLRDRACVVFPSDQRVHVEATGLFTYPDVTVVCDVPRFHPNGRDTLVNPRVLVEVLSSVTEANDRGAKFADYQRIDSLEEYVLVTQTSQRVEHYRRLETGQWLLTVSVGGHAVLVLPGDPAKDGERLDKIGHHDAIEPLDAKLDRSLSQTLSQFSFHIVCLTTRFLQRRIWTPLRAADCRAELAYLTAHDKGADGLFSARLREQLISLGALHKRRQRVLAK